MEEIIRIAALAIVIAVAVSVLNQYEKAYAVVVTAAACCLFLLLAARAIAPLVSSLSRLSEVYSAADFGPVIRAIGIAVVTQGAADICEDAGHKAIAGRVVLLGKISIIAATIPLFNSMIGILAEMMR